jgi:NAD(P)-dependent dehydrogenase (short-subunit alcohol dehydrogenase family)
LNARAPEFAGKVAIVTGAGSGIGLATARVFASAGSRLVIAELDATRGNEVAEELRAAGADAIGLACDVASETDVKRVVDAAFERYGRLDVIVNNAGRMIFKPIEAHDEADLLGIMRVDLFGAFWFIKQAFLRCGPGAAIVNVASIHAVETTPMVAAYAAAKAALVSLTRSAAIEGRAKGIRVNAVLPGAIETPMLRGNPEVRSGAEHLQPGDVGKPEDVARAIAYLASDLATFVNGAGLRIDGGRLATL